MSGYLARLAASVSRERSSIHPLVTPLFAGTQEAVELPAIEEEQIISPRSQTEVPEAQGDAHLPAIEEEQITSPRRQTEVREAPAEARQPEISRPGTSSAIDGAGGPRSEHPAAPVARTRPQVKPVSAAPEEPSSLSAAASQFPAPPSRNADEEFPAAGSYTPLLAVNTIQNAAPFASASVKQQRTRSSSSLHRARPAGEPDEVQIHIGRIEVTAVAPSPSSRAPINPARKSPSLDEYLKRGRR